MGAVGGRTLIVGIMLSVFSMAFQSIGIATALPTVMDDFDARSLYPWAFTTMVSGMLAATILAGPIADRRGPRAPILAGFAMFAVGLVLGWIAPDVWVVLAARAVQGIGAGALNLGLAVVLAHGFPPAERARAMALVSFCWLLPAFVGPPFAAWLTHYDWRLVFASMLPLVAVAFLLTRPGVRAVQAAFVPDDGDVAHPHVSATIAVTLAPSLILLAGQGLGWVSVACAGVGVAALGWGLPRILAPTARGFGPGIPSVVLTRAMQAGSFFAAEAMILVVLQDLRGYTPFEVGLALTVGSIGWTTGSWLQAQRWLRIDRDAYVSIGAVLSAAGVVFLTAFAWFDTIPLAAGLVSWVVAGLGMGLTMPSSAVAVMSLSSDLEQGRNQSSMQVAESVGNSVITAVAGGIYAALLSTRPEALGYTAALGAASVTALAAVGLSRRIGRIPNEL
ncbi:MFS transporter [Tessaracoccus defluvii]|uniref:MFS transporter n=1 Tax=Tessaracoccus defluvii TaxID=1285901 RepID=A0A7H0H9P7_9ACTN|nr:MFS transporter [Tessaracoccus defluvii]QNP57263.1 MFS transporter [Tessaracoccus defluvii]